MNKIIFVQNLWYIKEIFFIKITNETPQYKDENFFQDWKDYNLINIGLKL